MSLTNPIAFAIAALLSVAVTALIVRLSRSGSRWGMDDPDNARKSHTAPVSRLGGIPVFLVFAAAVGWRYWHDDLPIGQWLPVVLGCSAIFVIGLIDDFHPLGARVKLAGQLITAVGTFMAGVGIEKLSDPFGGGSIDLALPVAFVVTVTWLIALPNIINLIDGMDGLASGIGMFLCLTLGAVSLVGGHADAAFIAVAVAGSLLGFLFFNFPPAKIFLGDGGAYFIGYFIATVSVTSSNKGAIMAALLVVMIALGIPILDTAFAILRRGIKGLPLFRADADHIHHRLLLLGFSKGRALIALYAVCGALSLVGLGLFWNRGLTLPIAGAVIVLLALFAVRYLGYIESFRDIRQQVRRALGHRRDLRYATLVGELLEVEVDRCQSAAEFWGLFSAALDRLGFKPQPDEGNDALSAVEITLPDGIEWQLYYPSDHTESKNWLGIAQSLQGAYALALQRWGDRPAPPLPDEAAAASGTSAVPS